MKPGANVRAVVAIEDEERVRHAQAHRGIVRPLPRFQSKLVEHVLIDWEWVLLSIHRRRGDLTKGVSLLIGHIKKL